MNFFKLPEYQEGIDRLNAPKTLDGLRQWLGPMGDAAAERAELGAVVRWLVESQEQQRDPEGVRKKVRTVTLYMEARLAMAGIPSITGQPLQAEYLGFHRSRQSRVKKIAIGLLAAWRAAGQPFLDHSISYSAEYVRTALRNAGREVPQT